MENRNNISKELILEEYESTFGELSYEHRIEFLNRTELNEIVTLIENPKELNNLFKLVAQLNFKKLIEILVLIKNKNNKTIFYNKKNYLPDIRYSDFKCFNCNARIVDSRHSPESTSFRPYLIKGDKPFFKPRRFKALYWHCDLGCYNSQWSSKNIPNVFLEFDEEVIKSKIYEFFYKISKSDKDKQNRKKGAPINIRDFYNN
tara:strand:+ start:668 stop:1276 length:609 start_codon:yes stop_codon:yes gene_type:complete